MSGRTPVPGSALHGYRRRATTDHAQLPLSGLPSGQTLVQGLHQPPLSEQPAPGVFISSGGERAGAIAGALVGSPTCSSICRTVAGSVTELHGKYRAWSGRADLATVEEDEFGIIRCLWSEDLPPIFEFGTRNRNATPRRVGVATLEAVP